MIYSTSKKIFLFLFFASFLIYGSVHYLTLTPKSGTDYLYGCFLVASLIILLFSFFSRINLLKILSINIFILMSFIFILEGLFFFRIVSNVAILPIPTNFNNKQLDVIKLEQSPWFKFAPNKQIYSTGWRGNDFINSWTTDFLGYKNIETQQDKKKFDFLVVGDSFTEGMGSLVKHTWPSIINTMSSKQLYNAGVQGYAPSQFLGTVNYLQDKINFDGVIIGHGPNIYDREKNFLERPSKGIGGIEFIRINQLHKGLATPQILKIFANNIEIFFENFNASSPDRLSYKKIKFFLIPIPVDNQFLERSDFLVYTNEIIDPNTIKKKNDLKINNYWNILIESYKKIAEYCELNNKRLTIVGIPRRHEVYFSPKFQGINSKLDTRYYIEFELLKETLSKFDIKFVDTFPALALYAKDAPTKELPYFNQDGHTNKYGNRVISKSIISSF
jgi:hypothetical protein